MFDRIAAALSGGLNVAGALVNKRQADKQHQFNTNQYADQYSFQKDLAYHGIQRKVADARSAGIHPLAALGASPAYGSPVSVGNAPVADMSGMGQDIGRAVAATATNHERKMMDIQLDNAKLDNEMKRMEVTSQRRRLFGQVGPGIPDLVQNVPAIVTSHAKGKPQLEAGSVSSTGFARTPEGGLTPVPSKDVKERIEDQFIPETIWAAQNYIGPILGDRRNAPPRNLLPKGYVDWKWSTRDFQWKPVRKKWKTGRQKVNEFLKPKTKEQWLKMRK